MLRSVFASAGLPAGDRFDAWCALVSGSLLPVHNRSAHADDFCASVGMADLGGATLSVLRFPSVVCHRTPALVRRSDAEQAFLAVPLEGFHRMEWSGRQTALVPGELLLYDSSHAFDATSERAVIAVLELERGVLPPGVEPLLGTALAGGVGPGVLLRELLGQLAAGQGGYRPEDGERLGALLVDLLGLLVGQELGRPLPEEPGSRGRLLRTRVRAFVRARLEDPELTPARIAAAHHISVRYLHKLFEDESLTVAAYIRAQRLERARWLLADPTTAVLPLWVVAARCGFRTPGDLGRAFRAAYGVSPGEFRRGSAGVEGRADPA